MDENADNLKKQEKIRKILSVQKTQKQTKSLGVPYEYLQKQKATLSSMGVMNPYFKCNESISKNTTIIEGKTYINFSSYDYLGLSGHSHTVKRVVEAIQQYGTSCSSSRLAGGEKQLHRDLEKAIAKLLKVEDCVVFVGGYTTNVSCISHLFTESDLILYDSLSHNSLLMGSRLSGARCLPFPHNDIEGLKRLLIEHRRNYDKTLIIVEGVYSMDGDIPDIRSIIRLKNEFDAWLMVDEAHSMGVLGAEGKGISEYAELSPLDVEIWMGTLSKTFASCGGYIAGSHEMVEYLKYTAPGFIYSVGMSPGNAGAALGSIEMLLREPERVVQLQKQSRLFLSLCKKKGFNTGQSKDSPVIPIITGDSSKALYLSDELFKNQINVQPIFFPTVEENLARLRFFINCTHTDEQIYHTVDIIEKSLVQLEQEHKQPFTI